MIYREAKDMTYRLTLLCALLAGCSSQGAIRPDCERNRTAINAPASVSEVQDAPFDSGPAGEETAMEGHSHAQ